MSVSACFSALISRLEAAGRTVTALKLLRDDDIQSAGTIVGVYFGESGVSETLEYTRRTGVMELQLVLYSWSPGTEVEFVADVEQLVSQAVSHATDAPDTLDDLCTGIEVTGWAVEAQDPTSNVMTGAVELAIGFVETV